MTDPVKQKKGFTGQEGNVSRGLRIGSGFTVQGSGFRVMDSRFKVQGSRFRVQGLRVHEFTCSRIHGFRVGMKKKSHSTFL